MRLVGLELTRLRWRRAVVVLLLACVLITGAVFAITAWSTRPVSDAELRQAQEQVDRDRQSRGFQREIERCERRPQRYGVESAAQCEAMMGPRVEWYVDRPPLRFHDVLHGGAIGLIVLVTGLLMLAATTFVGADWNSGSMSNQLLFEPRRLRVWLGKAAAVVALSAATTGALLLAFWGAVWLLAGIRDISPVARVVDDIQGVSVRTVLFVAAAALGAYAVTMLFRSTVFTLGAMFAIVVGSTIVLAALGISERWAPHTNIAAVLFDGAQYWANPPSVCFEGPRPPEGVDCDELKTVTLWQGTRYLGLALVAAVGASLWSFRRRDVP